MRNRQADLKTVTGMMLDADLAALSALAREQSSLQLESETLRLAAQRARQIPLALETQDMAFAVQQGEGVASWCEMRMSDLNLKLAAIRARHEALQKAAQRSFGRNEALKSLLEKEKAARLQQRRRV